MIRKQSINPCIKLDKIYVADLLLSTRSLNVLTSTGITTLRQLPSQTCNDLLRSPNLGRKSLAEIESVLACYGLKLGTRFADQEHPADDLASQQQKSELTPSSQIAACLQNAYRWYRELAEQGCPAASNLLGCMHYWGKRASKSQPLAIKYFKLAADIGHPLAARNYALCRREAPSRHVMPSGKEQGNERVCF